MRVIGNAEAEAGTVKVKIVTTGTEGVIVGHNGKSMRYGRTYTVKTSTGDVSCSGAELEKLTEK